MPHNAISKFLLLMLSACWVLAGPAQAEKTKSASWLLEYGGKSSNQLMWDKRVKALIDSRVPAKLTGNLTLALGGPPDRLKARNRDCANRKDRDVCLATQYKVQYEGLINWTPVPPHT
jgi:hypothetical protein